MTEHSLTADNNVSETSVGDYVLADLIGSGAHGTVYQGYHSDRPNEKLAIKIVGTSDRWEIGTYDPKIFEARNLTELSGHANIVSMRDYFFHEKRFVIVMEHASDTSLSELLKRKGRFSSEEVTDFLFQTRISGRIQADLKVCLSGYPSFQSGCLAFLFLFPDAVAVVCKFQKQFVCQS